MPTTLYDRISDAIEDKIRDRKLRWLIAIPSSIASLLVLLGTALVWLGVVPKLASPVNVTLLVLALFLGIAVVILSISRRYMRAEIGRQDQILTSYGNRVREAQEKNINLFHTTRWSEETSLVKNGDATIVRSMLIEAGQDPVSAIWALSYRNSSAHLDQKIRDRVRVEARFVDENDVPGTEIVTTMTWEGDRALRVFLFFDRELAPGTRTSLQLTLKWPRYAADMLDGQTELNYWKFRRETEYFGSKIIYSPDFAPNGVRVTELEGSPKAILKQEKASGSTSIDFKLTAIEIGKEYGYRTELIRD